MVDVLQGMVKPGARRQGGTFRNDDVDAHASAATATALVVRSAP